MTSITAHSRTRRAVAAASALAVGLLGAAGLAGSASADPLDGAAVGNIVSPDQGTSSIVVHKYAKSSANGTVRGTGEELASVSGDPIEGALFTVTPVLYDGAPLDLLSSAGWQLASAAATDFAADLDFDDADYTLGTASAPVATSSTGLATFGNLGYGLYLVQEVTPLPEGVIAPAQPFLVSLPFPTGATHPTNPNEWLYTVHTYPKNAVTGVTKVVNSDDDAFFTAGEYVSWTITADVPRLAAGDTFTSFVVSDTVVDGELDFVGAADVPAGITGWTVTALDANGDPVALTAGTHYDITPAPLTAATTTASVTFTAAGRAVLEASAQGGSVVVTVPTKVVAVPAGGVIENDARLVVNSADVSDDANTSFGQLRVLKFATVNDTETQAPLAGAKFELYVDLDQDGVADAGEVDAANLVTVGGVSEWESDEDGLLTIPVLKAGMYLLVETEAPVGYILNATPRPVTITAGQASTTVNYIEFENSSMSPWMLPFTGGNGVVTFTVAGAALMALAVGFAFLAARRRKQAEQH